MPEHNTHKTPTPTCPHCGYAMTNDDMLNAPGRDWSAEKDLVAMLRDALHTTYVNSIGFTDYEATKAKALDALAKTERAANGHAD